MIQCMISLGTYARDSALEHIYVHRPVVIIFSVMLLCVLITLWLVYHFKHRYV